ncbi:MAG: D-alanine--D-alanine ligase [Helicobacteraceae bacterium]|nr:D-alanine--D-alanine ligase [Helicobacteraceae bacterium]
MKLSILFGGASFEHEISIVSAITVKAKLDNFELSFIFCDQDHTFYLIEASNMKANFFSSGKYKKSKSLTLTLGSFTNSSLFSSTTIDSTVLNLIHGGDGEDGSIASLLDFYKINYIGPRKEAAMFSFNKHYTKLYASSFGVKTLSHEFLTITDKRDVKTSYPFIVKPTTLGSSIGVSIVKEESELNYALDVAFEFDNTVIIEPFINNVKEYNLAGFKANGKINYSIVEEPQKNEFLDFDKKYLDFSRSQQVSEAELSTEMIEKLQDTFSKIYNTTFEGSLIRCDFFIIENEIYLNEINPIPGSMANYLFSDFKISLTTLFNSLPTKSYPSVSYQYINSISSAKGK